MSCERDQARELRLRGFDRNRKAVREVLLDEMDRLHRMNLEPWFVNIDADWWHEARRDAGDGTFLGEIMILPDGNWTFFGLPVRVYAPGSAASGGLRVHAYPPEFR